MLEIILEWDFKFLFINLFGVGVEVICGIKLLSLLLFLGVGLVIIEWLLGFLFCFLV